MRKAIGMVVVGAVLSIGASTARAADLLDQSSAAKYVADATTFIRVAASKEPAERRAMNKFVTTIQRDCPSSLPGSLLSGPTSEQRTYTALTEEATLEFGLAADSPLKAAADRFTSELARLRWNDKRLAQVIAISDHDVRVLFSLNGPRLCADVAAAAATGFTHTPQDTIAFLNTANRRGDSGGQADPTISAFLRSMKQYLRGDEQAMSRLRRLDHRVERVFDNLASREAARLVNTLVSAPA